MIAEGGGFFYVNVPGADVAAGSEAQFLYKLTTIDNKIVDRIDPRAWSVSGPWWNFTAGIVHDPFSFDWEGLDVFQVPSKASMVIYQVHAGVFRKTDPTSPLGTWRDIVSTNGLDYLRALGINAIEFLPISEFGGQDGTLLPPSILRHAILSTSSAC
jgi:1,4-alpha-glucan branching enzyme